MEIYPVSVDLAVPHSERCTGERGDTALENLVGALRGYHRYALCKVMARMLDVNTSRWRIDWSG